MPSQPDNHSREGEERTPSQPMQLPTAAEPDRLGKTFWKTFLTRMAISARLLGKEIYRNKLKWFDLRRADYRLGEKAYDLGVSPAQSQLFSQIEQLLERLANLRQRNNKPASTFSERAKGWVRAIAKAVQIAALEIRRRRIVKQLGTAARKDIAACSSLVGEVQLANDIAERIGAADAEIGKLRPQAYLWARRPLLVSSLLLLTIVGLASFGVAEQQRALEPEAQKKPFRDQVAEVKMRGTKLTAAQVDNKREAERKPAEPAQTEKVKAFREQVKRETLTNARLKVVYSFPRDVAELGNLYADKAGNLYGISRKHRF